MVFCLYVCVTEGRGGWGGGDRGGVPVLKSSVRADQDPVNQGVRKRIRARWPKEEEKTSQVHQKNSYTDTEPRDSEQTEDGGRGWG